MSETVGVRELRQNLSRHLERVKRGESLVVTERGREVARLIPAGAAADGYAGLAAEFGATIPTRRLEDIVRELEPLERPFPDGTTDAFLAEGRTDHFK